MSNTVGKKFTRLNGTELSKMTELTLPNIIGAKENFAQQISGLRILFIGAGAVGSPVILSFAQLQVEAIYIADPKRYREESIYSQLADRAAIGQFKAQYRAEICKALSPRTEVGYFNGPIQGVDLAELAGFNLIILSGDNFTSETYGAQLGLWLRTPLIHGSVNADATVSHVKTFANRDGLGPCPACLLNEFEWSQAHSEIEYSCEPGTGKETSPKILTIRTNCLPNTSLNCGSTVTTQAQRLKGGFGPPVEDTIHEFCGHTGKSYTTPLQRNPNCPMDHETAFRFIKSDREIELRTIADLAKESGMTESASFLVTIGGHDWVDPLTCPNGHGNSGQFIAGNHHPVQLSCAVCAEALPQMPFSRRDSVAAESLGASAGKSLSDLGAVSAPWIKIQSADKSVIVTNKN